MTRIALIGLMAVIAAASASAEPTTVSLTVTPSDFSSRDARAKLDRRIAAAIEEVCGSYAAIESYQWPALDDCRRSARAQVDYRLARIRAANTVEVGAR
jgi:UrcA family protein